MSKEQQALEVLKKAIHELQAIQDPTNPHCPVTQACRQVNRTSIDLFANHLKKSA